MANPPDERRTVPRITLPQLSANVGRDMGGIYGRDNPFLGVGAGIGPNTRTTPFAVQARAGVGIQPQATAALGRPAGDLGRGTGAYPTTPNLPFAKGMLSRFLGAANPFVMGMGGGVARAWDASTTGKLPFGRTGGTGGMGGAPALSPMEAAFRERYDKVAGAGAWDRFTQGRGMTPVDFYRMPNNKYWDEPDTPDGALNSAIRDEINNARNAQQWATEHGNTPIPQETWDRWYYANRQGMGIHDVMNDGSQVVY